MTYHSEPKPACRHDFQPPMVSVSPHVYSQRCVKCGVLAVDAIAYTPEADDHVLIGEPDAPKPDPLSN